MAVFLALVLQVITVILNYPKDICYHFLSSTTSKLSNIVQKRYNIQMHIS